VTIFGVEAAEEKCNSLKYPSMKEKIFWELGLKSLCVEGVARKMKAGESPRSGKE